jgi:uncharacterized protein YukE
VSSGGSSSVWWEEYLEKLKQLQQQTAGEGVSDTVVAESKTSSEMNPEEILAELQALQGDPEKLKARAAELASQAATQAQNVKGKQGNNFLKELASDLEAVAADGDLSAMEEKIARGADARPSGVKFVGPSGMSGGSDASMKWVKAIAEEDDEDDDSLAQTLEEYLEELEELMEKEKASAKALNADALNLEEAAREKAVR